MMWPGSGSGLGTCEQPDPLAKKGFLACFPSSPMELHGQPWDTSLGSLGEGQARGAEAGRPGPYLSWAFSHRASVERLAPPGPQDSQVLP